MIRQKIVAGNWKMNGSKESISLLINGLLEMEGSNSEVVVAPSFPYLSQVESLISGSAIVLAAQNVSQEVKGAFTGEVSASMLGDFGVKYVLLGHSERRSLYGEIDALVASKVKAVLDFGLVPMLCVGETLAEREAGKTLEVCERQIQAVIDVVGIAAFEGLVIAYEPVWAIGTGLSASAEQAQEVHKAIREFLAQSSESVSQKVQILYGGSVKASTSSALFQMPDVDGALVGGASLDAKEFIAIVKAAG
ncbi:MULTISPECIES: triose-phosphate isomerase [Marinomonas]|uniref:Triosephosphate isomerase n=1 Tax=Marinomonas arctica TaxID=383750 RepID=A0A7H1J3V6_9GAMM|nr:MULTISPECIES: triose-phosphate isomerase [Marinomonas]MCS7486953.1 triosephosphate isomerase [Marinomonas sp. BSi20414]QNT05172.1 triose-phosphate isomerase [Marinomonas arctica]GGN15495.1 triosephosphate isomerase [Marinomonas arctica]